MSKDKKSTSLVPYKARTLDLELIPDAGYSELSEIEKNRITTFKQMLKGSGVALSTGVLSVFAIIVGTSLWMNFPAFMFLVFLGLLSGMASGGSFTYTFFRLARLFRNDMRSHLPRSKRAKAALLEGKARELVEIYNESVISFNEGWDELLEYEVKVKHLRDPAEKIKGLIEIKNEKARFADERKRIEHTRLRILDCIEVVKKELGEDPQNEPKYLNGKESSADQDQDPD